MLLKSKRSITWLGRVPATKRTITALVVGTFMATGLPNLASAASWESLPPGMRGWIKQDKPPSIEAAEGDLTTGSIKGPGRHPVPSRPKPSASTF
jgi:hypothetical protein